LFRELCIQISDQFKAIGAGVNLKCAIIVGGLDPMSQAIALSKNPHISTVSFLIFSYWEVIGSPGRILYHLENTNGFQDLLKKNLKFLVQALATIIIF